MRQMEIRLRPSDPTLPSAHTEVSKKPIHSSTVHLATSFFPEPKRPKADLEGFFLPVLAFSPVVTFAPPFR